MQNLALLNTRWQTIQLEIKNLEEAIARIRSANSFRAKRNLKKRESRLVELRAESARLESLFPA